MSIKIKFSSDIDIDVANRDNALASEVKRMIGAGILEVEDEEFEDDDSREFDDATLIDVAQEDLR